MSAEQLEQIAESIRLNHLFGINHEVCQTNKLA